MQQKLPEITSEDAIEIVKLFEQNNIRLYIDGGWGVDALLGRQTRSHQDLDIAVEHQDVPKIRAMLAAKGYRDFPRADTKDYNFVLADDRDRRIDIHSYTFDASGNWIYGIPYPYESLTGTGTIGNYPVKCIAASWMVKFHTGYAVDENDYLDVKALCQQFDLELPPDYAEFIENDCDSHS